MSTKHVCMQRQRHHGPWCSCYFCSPTLSGLASQKRLTAIGLAELTSISKCISLENQSFPVCVCARLATLTVRQSLSEVLCCRLIQLHGVTCQTSYQARSVALLNCPQHSDALCFRQCQVCVSFQDLQHRSCVFTLEMCATEGLAQYSYKPVNEKSVSEIHDVIAASRSGA